MKMKSPATRAKSHSSASVSVASASPMNNPTKLTMAAETFKPIAIRVDKPSFWKIMNFLGMYPKEYHLSMLTL